MYGGDALQGLPFPTAPAHRITPPALDPQSTGTAARRTAATALRCPLLPVSDHSQPLRPRRTGLAFICSNAAGPPFPGSALSMTRPMKNNMEKPG